ncbi:MAG: MFS transporter [Acidobacteriia bacterium]|nr:MFS transporter [Terriglobia bacterium]
MSKESLKAMLWGLATAAVTALLVVAGSRNLAYFDAELIAYTFAVLFAVFAIAYRYSMWLQRPPTALYWKRGWQVFFRRRFFLPNTGRWFLRVAGDFALNRFIFRRGRLRGLAHWLIMWGCIVAVLITVPLSFGWIHFESVPGHLRDYRAYLFGFPTLAFPLHSGLGFLIYHALDFAAVVVIAGVMLAMRRRMRDHDAASLQMFGEDFLPLVILFAISVTGLMLTGSYTWMKGYAYDFITILHAITVIFGLLWLPFGKFFHIFQRPAQLGVSFYKDVGKHEEKAHCRRCDHAFTSRMKVEDLIKVERELGYNYTMADPASDHYQWFCPRCRRAMLILAQSALWGGIRGGQPIVTAALPTLPQSALGIPHIDFGPLGKEDEENFHP